LTLSNGIKIPVSRSYVNETKRHLGMKWVIIRVI
jgi:two-component system response regulator LytT